MAGSVTVPVVDIKLTKNAVKAGALGIVAVLAWINRVAIKAKIASLYNSVRGA